MINTAALQEALSILHADEKPLYLNVQEEDLTVIDEKTFEQLFKSHYQALYAYAYTFLKDEMQAEETVQGFFLKAWEKRNQLGELLLKKSYLYKSIYHDCLNQLRHQKVKNQYSQQIMYLEGESTERSADTRAHTKELEQQITEALIALPEQCRTIFQMSRFEELKYREIAEALAISVKTVENQMGKALKIMRSRLTEFLSLMLWLINHFNN
ncbi:RNA polymerase sigma-70 factor [Pedobacter glucosidilyticus]|uniref:RNA polymerase sigma-70 factor n=1 Tax=Pedobacter glucosidilyticus TaxID=1122941 RepID=UPI00042581AB|nr:RNA polymerase sigma-70 factor [Pedobacter glucosidilyticus]